MPYPLNTEASSAGAGDQGVPEGAGPPFPPGFDPINNDYVETSNLGIVTTQLESNRFTSSAWPPPREFMNLGTFRFEQFAKGIHEAREGLMVALPDMEFHRYRCRRITGDAPDDGLVQFLGLGEWSAWQGGVPGAPQSNLRIASYTFFFNQFGFKTGSFQTEVEIQATSEVISNRTVRISLRRDA